LVGWLISSLIG